MIHSFLLKAPRQEMVKRPQIRVYEYFSHCLIQLFIQRWVRRRRSLRLSAQWDAVLQDYKDNSACIHTKKYRLQLHRQPSGSLLKSVETNKYAPMGLNTHTNVQSLKLLAKLPSGNWKSFELKTQTALSNKEKKKKKIGSYVIISQKITTISGEKTLTWGCGVERWRGVRF